jgi:hypothetical protein
VSGHSGDREGRWSRLGVVAQIATILGVPIAVIGIVLAAMALETKTSSSENNTTGSSTTRHLTAPEPTESDWETNQGRLCQEMNRQAAANPSPASPDLSDQLPTLRAASTIIEEFVAKSADLHIPDSYHDQVRVMLEHWSDAAVFMTGMVRSAEQSDVASFNQRYDQFNDTMEQGLGVARDLGAVQCR